MSSVGVSPRPGIADRLSRMIALPTVSAERAERGDEPFLAFADLIAELYPHVHAELDLEVIGEGGLLYRWHGTGDADPVVLMAHYDVVPVDLSDDWTHDPFSGAIIDGFVHGRGALDDKGPLVVMLDAVENLLTDGFSPARDVYVWLGPDEESHGAAAREGARVLHERGITPWLVLDEGGAVVDAPLPFVDGTAAMVGVGEKGVLSVRLTARGDGGHASAPPKLTAVGRIARAIERLTPGTFPSRTPRTITAMLTALGQRTSGAPRLLLRLLIAVPRLSAFVFTRLGGEPAAMVRTTIAPTMFAGGTADNVLPSQASATINLRLALGTTIAQTVRRLEKRINDRSVTVTVIEGDEPSPESATDNAPFALITEAVATSHPAALTVPYIVFAATDARHFHRFAPAVYRFAPLSMSSELRATLHGVNERVAVSELERGELFHRTLITRLPR